jgi:hypothetical protein
LTGIAMSEFDLVIKNGTVATGSDVFLADVGVKGEYNVLVAA